MSQQQQTQPQPKPIRYEDLSPAARRVLDDIVRLQLQVFERVEAEQAENDRDTDTEQIAS